MTASDRIFAPTIGLGRLLLAAVLALTWCVAPLAAQDDEAGLRARVEAIAARHGFVVVGLEHLENAPAGSLRDADPASVLESLLVGYNYLLAHDGEGGVERLRILGAKPRLGAHTTVSTERRGGHQLVETELVGPNGVPQRLSLTLDTGATTIVLPSSMIEPLGFEAEALQTGTASTANGPVPIRLGSLASVRIGRAKVRDVAVGFIADERIGGQRLLGMSFLNHFRVTLDDESDRLILLAK